MRPPKSYWILSVIPMLIFIHASNTHALPIYASNIIDSSPASPGYPIKENILGAPDYECAEFNDDGINPGFIVVEFDLDFLDGPGDDIAIYLKNFSPNDNEGFHLYASQDGVNFSFIGTEIASSVHPVWQTRTLDMADGSLNRARYIKLVNHRLDFGKTGEGPEYDAIEAMNPVPEPAAMLLLGSGLLGLDGARRKFKK